MYEMILHIAIKEKTVSLRQLERETGLKKNEIKEILNALELKGKIHFMNMRELLFHSCGTCSLKGFCKKEKNQCKAF